VTDTNLSENRAARPRLRPVRLSRLYRAGRPAGRQARTAQALHPAGGGLHERAGGAGRVAVGRRGTVSRRGTASRRVAPWRFCRGPSLSVVNGEECATCDPASGCASSVKHGWGNDAPVLNAPTLAGPVPDTVDATTARRPPATPSPRKCASRWPRRYTASGTTTWARVRLPSRSLPRRRWSARADRAPQPDDHPRARDRARRDPHRPTAGHLVRLPDHHCGIVQSVDMFTGAVVWCVTGPLHPRQHGFKDIGYYSAQAYEGLITRRVSKSRSAGATGSSRACA